MRGKAAAFDAVPLPPRITPAYAGKSLFPPFLRRCPEDHPRLCGEKAHHNHGTDFALGSPPPMRGKAALPAVPLLRSGITPAYAGKSDVAVLQHGVAEDHPRLCGEKSSNYIIGLQGERITPAYAGKSFWDTDLLRDLWDHPRLCGEKQLIRQGH